MKCIDVRYQMIPKEKDEIGGDIVIFNKENNERDSRILLIFSKGTCIRKPLPDIVEGRYRLVLMAVDTGLLEDTAMELMFSGGGLQINGRELSGRAPFYFYTEKNEKLLLLLSEKLHFGPGERLAMQREESFKAGSSFKNQIFFECFSLVSEVHLEIHATEQGMVIDNAGNEGVYLNEKAFTGKGPLQSGDRVDIYGLHLLILKETVICTAFCGICRVAGRYTPVKPDTFKKMHGDRVITKKAYGQEESLHTGEVEILLPEIPSAERSHPLFLSMGPAVTMVLPMLLMAWMMNGYMEGTGGGFYYLSALMSGCSALLAVFWALLGHGYGKYSGRRERKEKEKQYREYLEGMEEEISFYQAENRRILEEKYPSLKFFLEVGGKESAVLWNRYYRQKDFLFFRLGSGDIPFHMKIKLSGQSKSIVQRRLTGEAERLAERFAVLEKAPVGVNLYENRQIGVWGNQALEEALGIVMLLMMQIAVSHCYTEVKTVCFYHKERSPEKEIADCFRWLSHSWSVDRRTRFLAGNELEAGEILPVLTRELMLDDRERKEGVRLPWYIAFILNEELIQGEPLYRCLTEPEGIYPVSAVFVGKEREALPKCCRLFLTAENGKGEILNPGNGNTEKKTLLLESCHTEPALRYIRSIAGFGMQETKKNSRLPEKADFLQLYGCRRVEELESGRRWKISETGERLKVPIGFGAGGRLVSLDVHEKFHGPHGLVAGTTGSGKSELLQTYLLSVAVNFSPEDVNFFMIDYKGGGTGNLLKSLPHCAGVISNLSGKQIRRAMSAIASENRRRQRILSNFHVNHIDAYTMLYRKGEAKSAMPHLLLVVDEFAELKKEEPEFMREIISLAQVGRSLGVHLILATQKPAGTVDDKIWSNARFRLCLRVQDRQDSLDMLHSDEAASLTAPGQCYLQIGNHEYFELFQAGYCGEPYRAGEEKKAKAVLLSDTGKRTENREKENGVFKSQMDALIEYIRKTADNSRYLPASPLWLPELPEKILLKELAGKSLPAKGNQGEVLPGRWEKEMIIGLCDDPENQCSFPLKYQPSDQGHLAVCGGPATGKTVFLETVLWQIGADFTAGEELFAVIDMRREGTGSFAAMPHCLGALTDKEGREVFFHHLKERVGRRKKLLSGISFEQYNLSGKERLPRIFLVIDNYGALKTLLEEKEEAVIMRLASEGLSLGFSLIISASDISDIGGKLYEKIKTAFSLEMSDRFQYGDVLRQYHIPVLPKENQKGRGLCRAEGRILEFQTALFDEEQTGFGCAEMIEETGRKMRIVMDKEGITLPEKFPEIPAEPVFNRLVMAFDWKSGKLPLGYCLTTGEICAITPRKSHCFLISGNERCGKSNLLSCLAKGMLLLRSQVVIVDFEGKLQAFGKEKEITYLESKESVERWRLAIQNAKAEGEKKDGEPGEKGSGNKAEKGESRQKISVFISDMGRFCKYLYESGTMREEREAFWEKAAGGDNGIEFLTGIYHPKRDYEAVVCGFFREFTAWRQGIHLGGNAGEQRVLSFDDLGYAKLNQPERPGIGYFKEAAGRETRRLLLPLYGKGETE